MEVLNPRSVLVTGSNRGIGLELVKQLVEKSNPPERIFATCRDPEGPRAKSLKNLAAQHQHRVEVIQLDTSDPSSIQAAAATITERLHGAGLNLLFNNAGIVKPSTVESETPENMSEVYNTNVIGPMVMGQVFLPLLKKASQESVLKGMSCSKAAIVNISSDCGSISNVLGWDIGQVLSYRCSKAALNMLSRCQSLQHAKDEILCVALHPGWLQTDMGEIPEILRAPTTVEDGVREILETLARLSEKETGTFVNSDGKPLPW
ncbi:C-factor-like [Crotalus adamanteus]|uniref:C-factor-like n=1 Tax=Crotalus adamanteus TaxID=8729 RepID=A0AAW1ATF6_CROAD